MAVQEAVCGPGAQSRRRAGRRTEPSKNVSTPWLLGDILRRMEEEMERLRAELQRYRYRMLPTVKMGEKERE